MSFDVWMLGAPKWQLRVLIGVGYGVLYLFMSLTAMHQSLGEALVSTLFSSVFFGFLFGSFLARTVREQRESLELPDRAQEREAIRAVGRGPVPDDPHVRAAALRLARSRLMQAEQNWSPVGIVTVAVLVLGLAAAAIWLSPWIWVVPPVLVALWIYSRYQANRLAGRAALLAAAA